MFAAVRTPARPPAAPVDEANAAANQRRVDEAFRLLGALVARIVTTPNPSLYLLDFASQDGHLQAIWCRDGSSAFLPTPADTDPAAIGAGAYGPVNAERYQRAQKALSTLLLELTRPGCHGSATLRLRGTGGELSDDIRAESHRQWCF
jgi:hypothetical protein